MEDDDYEELDGRADENEWIADDVKRAEGRRGGGGKGVVVVE